MKSDCFVLDASEQITGSLGVSTSAVSHFADEFFAIADGSRDEKNGDTAAKLAVETAIWGYKHVRQRPYYWSLKHKLLARIFRTTNIMLWQKRKEDGFEQGLASALSAVIVGAHSFWVGSVGNSPVYLYRDGLVDDVSSPNDSDEQLRVNVLGAKRFDVQPRIRKEAFLPGDIIVVTTDAVAASVSEGELRTLCEEAGDSRERMSEALNRFLRMAFERGRSDSASAYILLKPKPVE